MSYRPKQYELQFDNEGQAQYGGQLKFREELGFRQIIMWQINRINLCGSEAMLQPASQHLLAFSMAVDMLEGTIAAYLPDKLMALKLDMSNLNNESQYALFTKIRDKYMVLIYKLRDMGLLLQEVGEATI